MAKFKRILQHKPTAGGPDVFNRAGGPAFRDSPLMALYRQVATALWSGDGYYEKHNQWLERFQSNVNQAMTVEPRFPFALAAYARDPQGLGLRSSAVALWVEAACHPLARTTGLARRYATQVLRRADDPGEALAYFRLQHSGNPPHGIVRGIADVLPSFDEYQLGKYARTGSLRDVLRLARPKPSNEEQRRLWGLALHEALSKPYTWEVELSRSRTPEEKRAKWNELIASGRLGIFALVRNLRNIIDAGADIEEALAGITRERVHASGILPFQWFKAYRAVGDVHGIEIAAPLGLALEWSLEDMPRLTGTTLVVCDNSGSMTDEYKTRGISNAELGNLLGAMALFICERGLAGTFGERFALADTDLQRSVLWNMDAITQCGKTTGYSTDAWTIFDTLIREQVAIDRLILVSDMQCYDSDARWSDGSYSTHSLMSGLETYQQINPQVVVYSLDIASHDNSSQFAPEQPVIALAGWSEQVLQFIEAMEAGESVVDWILEEYGESKLK